MSVHRRHLTLLTVLPGAKTVSYHVPLPLPDEAQAAWVGRAANLAALSAALDSVHPLVPRAGERAWARAPEGGAWIPVHGFGTPIGTSLAGMAQDGQLLLAHFWNTVPAVIELLRAARRRGLLLERLGPDELIMQAGRPLAVVAPDHWMAYTPNTQHDTTRVAADFMHWFLCALRQTPAGGDFPPALWAICARGLEGLYARTGLFKLVEDLTAVARRPLLDADSRGKRACLCIDIRSVQAVTGAYLNPWLTLEALSEPGRTFDPLVALHDGPVPAALAQLLKDARFVLQPLSGQTPGAVAGAIDQVAGGGRMVQLITGAVDDAAELSHELGRAGHPCEVIAFRAIGDGHDAERSRLRAALFLAQSSTESEGGGLSGASVEIAANGAE